MRSWLIECLLALALWLDTDHTVHVCVIDPDHLRRARAAVAIAEGRFGSGFGSAKRRDALALLLKQGLTESAAAFAIELVLR